MIFSIIFYTSLILVLVYVTIKAKETDEHNEPVFLHEDSDLNTQDNEKVFLSHFIFMLLAIVCKFVTVILFLMYLTGILE